jgi:excisionase family DNA binding protein
MKLDRYAVRLPEEPLTLLGVREVCAITGLSRSMLYELTRDEKFPQSVDVGCRTIRYRAGQVKAWLESREPRKRA